MSGHRNEHDIHRQVTPFPDLNGLEMHLLGVMLHKQIQVDKYLIGPSFRDRHQQAFVDHLNTAMPLLKDAFVACATLLVGNQEVQQVAKNQHIGHKRAASAVCSLRFLEIHHCHDLPMVLILGVAMVTFALHHSGGESLLCRHILGLTKPIYEDNHSLTHRLGSDGLSFLICLLGTQTVECLLRCQIPTIRIRASDVDQVVDRFIGVSAPLLAHFYDICELSRLIHHSSSRHGNGLLEDTIEQALDNVEQAVERWQPTLPADFLAGHFTPAEVVWMLAQAKVLRLTALLVIHRLRWAFGTKDDKALAMSNAILNELDLAARLAGWSIPFVDLAYLVAGFEITNCEERRAVLEKSDMIVTFSPRVLDSVQIWLVSFWAVRDTDSHRIYWNDLGSFLPES